MTADEWTAATTESRTEAETAANHERGYDKRFFVEIRELTVPNKFDVKAFEDGNEEAEKMLFEALTNGYNVIATYDARS